MENTKNKLINNINPNKYNCGYETIYYALEFCYTNTLTPAEFYFLANPFSFNFLPDGVSLSYNSISTVFDHIRLNIFNNIIQKTASHTSFSEIIEALNQENIAIFFVKSEMLYYHSFKMMRCPYHMIIAYDYDVNEKCFATIDLYVQEKNDISCKLNILKIDYLINNLIEFAIMPIEKNIIIEMDRDKKQKIVNTIYNTTTGELESLFNCYFYRMCLEKNIEKMINSLAIFKWMIIIPLFTMLEELCLKENILDINQKVIELKFKWNQLILRSIKEIYYKKKQFVFNNEKKEIIQETNEMLISVVKNISYK